MTCPKVGNPTSDPILVTENPQPCPCQWGPHLKPYHPLSDLILGTEGVFALPPWGDIHLIPILFTEDPPLALPPWGTFHLELNHCSSNPIPVSEDPLARIPRVRSHLKFHHCPSNPICATEALTCHVPMRGPRLNAALVTEDSFALCPWWGSYDKPHPRHP